MAYVAPAGRPHLNEAVAVLRREEDGVVEALRRVAQVEERGRGVEEEARALAPHFARLGDMVQRLAEHAVRLAGPEEPTVSAARRADRCVSCTQEAQRRPAPTW